MGVGETGARRKKRKQRPFLHPSLSPPPALSYLVLGQGDGHKLLVEDGLRRELGGGVADEGGLAWRRKEEESVREQRRWKERARRRVAPPLLPLLPGPVLPLLPTHCGFNARRSMDRHFGWPAQGQDLGWPRRRPRSARVSAHARELFLPRSEAAWFLLSLPPPHSPRPCRPGPPGPPGRGGQTPPDGWAGGCRAGRRRGRRRPWLLEGEREEGFLARKAGMRGFAQTFTHTRLSSRRPSLHPSSLPKTHHGLRPRPHRLPGPLHQEGVRPPPGGRPARRPRRLCPRLGLHRHPEDALRRAEDRVRR